MTLIEANLDAPPVDDLFDWPLFGLQDDVRPALAEAAARGEPAVLATLYDILGAAPRKVGAQMVFTENTVAGFLSGGCIEADLAINARQVLVQKKSRRLTYGQGGPMDIRLPCGSRIDVLLEPVDRDDVAVARLLQFERERRPAVWLTTGDERICVAAGDADWFSPKLRAVSGAAMAASGRRTCGHIQAPFGVFRAFAPHRRLIVIGADPIAIALTNLAAEVGFETTLVRPRGPETCPLESSVRYDRSDAPTAICNLRPDAWTAIAILTHNAEQEQAALIAALASTAGYVGVLGSRSRAPARSAYLAAAGISDDNKQRIHAPIGLAIGSNAPWEIAVSIIAEIVRDLDAARIR